jgi:hypothetical protein
MSIMTNSKTRDPSIYDNSAKKDTLITPKHI